MATNYNGALNMDYSTASPFTFKEGEYLVKTRGDGFPSSGQTNMSRDNCTLTNVVVDTQQLRLVYFTAYKTETINSLKVVSGGTAAAATPTLCKLALFAIEDNGDLTLLSQTANDTTLFSATSVIYTRAMLAPVSVIAGKRYAFGILVVTAVAAPRFLGNSVVTAAENAVEPRVTAYVPSLSDIPSTVAAASLVTSGSRFYAVLLP